MVYLAAVVRRAALLLLFVLGCRKPHRVVLEVSTDARPDGCLLHVQASSSSGPVADVTVVGRTWSSAPLDVEDDSFVVTATLESKTPDPACDVPVSCRVLVDGREQRGEVSPRKVRCAATLISR